MIGASSLVTGPDGTAATQRALAWADETAGQQPGSILCITQSRERADAIREQWRDSHNQLRIQTTTLDGFVSSCYERATESIEGGTLGRADRLRLVEAAIDEYDATGSPFADVEQLSPELTDQVQGAFSLLAYAGYDDAKSIETALRNAGSNGTDIFDPVAPYGSFRGQSAPAEESPLSDQAATLSGIFAKYEQLRAEYRPDWETVIAERYLELLESNTLVDAVPDAVDAIIFDGLTRLAPLERAAIQRLDSVRPAVAVLPLVHPESSAHGVDKGVAQSLAVYRTLGFSLEYETPATVNQDRLDALRQLGVHSTERPSYRGTDLDLQRWKPATERTEVRTAARRVRELLADGVEPADIGIVVADRATYRGPLGEVLPVYDIPFTFANKIGIEQTLVGDALLSLLDIADGTDGGLAIQALAGNQLTDLSEFGISASTVEQMGAGADADAIEALLTALEDADGEHEETIIGITDLQETLTGPETFPTLLDAVGGVLETVDMESAVNAYQQADAATGSHRPAYESSAWNAVTRVIESFEQGPTITTDDPAGRLRQALLAELVSGPRQQSNYVRVLPLAETAMESFEHLFVLGLTAGYVPTESDTMAFFGSINDADEEFSRAHTGRRARYLFGTLVSGSKEVVLSTPRHTVGGTEHTTAPIVAELERYVDFEDDSDIEVPRVESEDIQRDYAAWASRESFESPAPAKDALETATGLAESTARFAQQGVTASWRRSQSGLTAHEAQLDDVFESVFARDAVAPFSPSALEDYARCPFLYLTKRVLGFEEEYDDDAEIDRGDRGIYIHDVLATFYRDLQTAADEPVDIDTFDREILERRLLAAAKTHLADLEPIESLFAKRTIARLFAGLGDPDANPYYTGYIASAGETTTERGLLVRFLDEETEGATNRQLQPTHFEAAINLDFDGTELLRDGPVSIATPEGTVDVHGIADRLDTHPIKDAFSIVDYKTGSVPSKIDVKRGTKLQLPLYGLAFESVLDSKTDTSPEAVAGSYYELSDPSSVAADSTFVSSADAQYDGEPPLVAGGGRPLFDTRAEFSRFIRDVTATRLGRIATSIDDGFFEPTLLDENHANCDSCSFKHVCDVRNHHRRETINGIGDGTHYVSERARDVDIDLSTYPGGDD